MKSWQSNQAPRLKKKYGSSLFQLLTNYPHKPASIWKPFQFAWSLGKIMQNWACPYLNTIRLAVAPGLGRSAAGSHGAVCLAKSMWKSEQEKGEKKLFSLYRWNIIFTINICPHFIIQSTINHKSVSNAQACSGQKHQASGGSCFYRTLSSAAEINDVFMNLKIIATSWVWTFVFGSFVLRGV